MDFLNEIFLDKEEIEAFLVGFWDLGQKDIQSFNMQNHGEFKKIGRPDLTLFQVYTLLISAGWIPSVPEIQKKGNVYKRQNLWRIFF